MVSASPKTIRQRDGIAWAGRDLPMRSSIWVSGIPKVAACPKTMPRQCDGIAWPPSRDLPWRSSIWVSGMPKVAAFPKYLDGLGVPQNHTEAVRWLSHGCRAGICRWRSSIWVNMYSNGRRRSTKITYRGLCDGIAWLPRRKAIFGGAVQSWVKSSSKKMSTGLGVTKAQELSREY